MTKKLLLRIVILAVAVFTFIRRRISAAIGCCRNLHSCGPDAVLVQLFEILLEQHTVLAVALLKVVVLRYKQPLSLTEMTVLIIYNV